MASFQEILNMFKKSAEQADDESDTEYDGQNYNPDRQDSNPDRDQRAIRFKVAKSAKTQSLEPDTPGGHRNNAWGGSMRRMTDAAVMYNMSDDENPAIPGQYVPIGFARYTSPTVDPKKFDYYRVAGWRVAVPRSMPSIKVRDLLHRIFYYGPQSAGYVRVGSSLVPAVLEPGDRMALASSTIDYEEYPLSP